MSEKIDEIIENINTLQDVSEVVRDVQRTSKSAPYNQSGGFINPLGFFGEVMKMVYAIIAKVLLFIYDLGVQLFSLDWHNPNRALFYKYIWFCIKCGGYLLIFGIAGPIFVVIGISMVYSKMLSKMGTDGKTLVRERLSATRDL